MQQLEILSYQPEGNKSTELITIFFNTNKFQTREHLHAWDFELGPATDDDIQVNDSRFIENVQ